MLKAKIIDMPSAFGHSFSVVMVFISSQETNGGFSRRNLYSKLVVNVRNPRILLKKDLLHRSNWRDSLAIGGQEDLAMMGTQKASAQLFYDFDLEAHVPGNHMLRQIDRFLDMDGIRIKLRPFYSKIGRPSIDPELIVRILVIGYVMGIRFERRLCEEVHLDLAYRWFCRLDIDSKVPDHSTFSKYRPSRRCKHRLPASARQVPRQ